MSAKVLGFCFWFGGTKLSLIPLKSCYARNSVITFKVLVITPILRNIWWLFLLFSFLVTSHDLCLSLMVNDTKNLVRIMYHTFMLIIKTASTAFVFVFQDKPTEICNLLNCLSQQSSQTFNSKASTNNKRSSMILVLLWISTFEVFTFYLFIIPLFAMALPCAHDSPMVKFLFSDCSSIIFRFTIFITQFLFMLPVSAIAISGSCIVLFTLRELTTRIGLLW